MKNENGEKKEEDILNPPHLRDKHLPGVKEKVEGLKREYERFEPVQCPPEPDPDYPLHYPLVDITANWPPDSPSSRPSHIYNSLCYFDYSDPIQRASAYKYRLAEVPFVVRGIPDLDDTVLRWGDITYMNELFGSAPGRI